jgi:hypothetical protein
MQAVSSMSETPALAQTITWGVSASMVAAIVALSQGCSCRLIVSSAC